MPELACASAAFDSAPRPAWGAGEPHDPYGPLAVLGRGIDVAWLVKDGRRAFDSEWERLSQVDKGRIRSRGKQECVGAWPYLLP